MYIGERIQSLKWSSFVFEPIASEGQYYHRTTSWFFNRKRNHTLICQPRNGLNTTSVYFCTFSSLPKNIFQKCRRIILSVVVINGSLFIYDALTYLNMNAMQWVSFFLWNLQIPALYSTRYSNSRLKVGNQRPVRPQATCRSKRRSCNTFDRIRWLIVLKWPDVRVFFILNRVVSNNGVIESFIFF